MSLANLDRERLEHRATQERLTDAVLAIERLASRSAAGEQIATWELHEIAHDLRSPTLDR